MTLHDLDGVVAELLRNEPERSSRAKWARRWAMKIDRTLEFARKNERPTDPFGLLAAAAVTLLEAQDLPPDDWNHQHKVAEAARLVRIARGEL